MADVYVIQESLAFDPPGVTSRSTAVDGVTEDFPIRANVPIAVSTTLGPSKTSIRDAIRDYVTGLGHTAIRVVYADMTMDLL